MQLKQMVKLIQPSSGLYTRSVNLGLVETGGRVDCATGVSVITTLMLSLKDHFPWAMLAKVVAIGHFFKKKIYMG